jgi:hypothetical protein
VTIPSERADQGWPEGCAELAEQLLHGLAISDRQWHAVKGQPARRAAEQMAAALVQLLASDDPRRRAPDEAQQQAVALLENALAWLKGEIRDPGCPQHRR